MWDRAGACFHADKKPPDSCGRGSSGCGRTVLNFKPVRALTAWNASRMDGASALRMESEPPKRWYSRSAGRLYPETGSDGKWPAILAKLGIAITPWQPANCGWEV